MPEGNEAPPCGSERRLHGTRSEGQALPNLERRRIRLPQLPRSHRGEVRRRSVLRALQAGPRSALRHPRRRATHSHQGLNMEKTIRMALERETKGAIRYQETNARGDIATLEESLIGTLYIRKSALPPREVPTTLDVTVRTA